MDMKKSRLQTHIEAMACMGLEWKAQGAAGWHDLRLS